MPEARTILSLRAYHPGGTFPMAFLTFRSGRGPLVKMLLSHSPQMFTFFNTVEVLPISCVDAIRHFLRDSGLAVPVVLKPKSGMQGFVALHAWIPLSEPVCRLLPTELVVAKNRAAELRHLLQRFVREVQDVVKIAEREEQHRQRSKYSPEGLFETERNIRVAP